MFEILSEPLIGMINNCYEFNFKKAISGLKVHSLIISSYALTVQPIFLSAVLINDTQIRSWQAVGLVNILSVSCNPPQSLYFSFPYAVIL